ncbi:tRNA (adenosine(37)-N6)-threonylcarbamoyltransferase complex transferase subunit TsaD [Kamptonema cortianum]|nr:tRNA (adenosine(37)-N6)-threonylcarbamoyltransferase complex transferase subunit TsaD [Geitlerinema splendidum]MDK3158612.1 tRNA (adenosine(37)-N6)-threonylcarbamoyltransferase complex transferase subunit TsaD [Kamptonema cortianum]
MDFFPNPILAIETSCDETSAAVVVGREVQSNVIASQASMHAKWGGVVPEVASRAHVEAILPVIQEALERASNPEIHAICVTNRPGLVGALSVGVSAAKAIAYSNSIPLLGIHHLEGHLMSPWGDPSLTSIEFPFLSLVVSGGHTEIILSQAPGEYQIIGQTIDDAAGEAFDKGARLLGLGYPGGAAIQAAAELGNPAKYALPRALPKDPDKFSFSGLKTAMLRLVQKEGDRININDAAASLQQAIIDVLIQKSLALCELHGVGTLCLVGGVSANKPLRDQMQQQCELSNIKLHVPPYSLCTDNAGMIGLAGSFRLALGETSDLNLDVHPNAPTIP